MLAAATVMLMPLAGCLDKDDDDKDYSGWRKENLAYVEKEASRTEDGSDYYDRIVPVWAPGEYVLVHWHNKRAPYGEKRTPLDNSTVHIKYHVRLIDGTPVDSSYNLKAHGDSIYQTRPNSNITGMWAALTQMNVGDSVSMVVPYRSGYGNVKSGKVKPYSTLLFDVKLVDIPGWETPY